MEPIKKIDQVREYAAAGQYRKALAIVKTFRPIFSITAAQIDTMTRAYECMTNARFYASIGVDLDSTIDRGIETLLAVCGSAPQPAKGGAA